MVESHRHSRNTNTGIQMFSPRAFCLTFIVKIWKNPQNVMLKCIHHKEKSFCQSVALKKNSQYFQTGSLELILVSQ